MQLRLLLLLFSFTTLAGFADCSSCELKPPTSKIRLKKRVRARSLHNVDDLLNWTLSQHLRTYALLQPLQTAPCEITFSQAKQLIEWYGFFSVYDPLIGKISKRKGGLEVAQCLLIKVAKEITDPLASQFATEEILAKIVAYRDLKVNDQILIPKSGRLISYSVDHVFDLWHGMPAFGLIGDQGAEPILLFRGTDLSLASERGWASLMCDVDPAGPGLTAFNKARQEIHSWLMNVSQKGPKAKVIGFSLGASLAAYTYLYENNWVNPEGCVAFNPPGFSDEVLKQWAVLSNEKKQAFHVYVNRGDLVSKVGKLFGDVYELSLDERLKPLRAHTLFFSAQGKFFRSKVDVDKENLMR